MKLVLAIISDDDSKDLSQALNKAGFQVTKLATTGGFLAQGNTTLIIGAAKEKVDEVIGIIKENCSSSTQVVPSLYSAFPSILDSTMEVKVSGATIFVINVDQFIKV